MATFVLVHGGRHGGWCWRKLDPLLRSAGHEVYRPSLTGLGDRAHLLGRFPVDTPIDLETHVADITGLLTFEDLTDVVLIGHSYGGMVITGVADRVPGRLARLVYLDAQVPHSGEAVFDIAGTATVDTMRGWIAGDGGGTRVPSSRSTPEFYGITDPADIAWVAPRLTDQPAATYQQPLLLTGAPFPGPRTYLRCTRSDAIAPAIAERVRAEGNFDLVDLDAAHDVMITDPVLLATVLLRLVAAGAGRRDGA